MDNFKALPKLNEKLEEMIASGEARLATVVASYGNEVEVTVTGGARARFPSTHIGVPVGSSGALIATRGGGRLFVATGIAMPFQNTHRVNTSTTPRTYPGTAAPAGATIQLNQHVALLVGGGNFIHTDGVPWVQVYHPNRGVVWVNMSHLTAL